MAQMTSVNIAQNADIPTQWDVSGQVNGHPISVSIDLYGLALRHGSLPTRQDVLNELATQVRREWLMAQVAAMASDVPVIGTLSF